MKKIRDSLLKNLLLINLFSAYTFFHIGSLNVNANIICVSVILVLSLFLTVFGKERIKKSVLGLGLFSICYLGICLGVGFSEIGSADLNSFTLYLFNIFFFLISMNFRFISPTDKLKIKQRYISITTFCSVLGILQFLLQFTKAGFITFNFPLFYPQGYNYRAYNYSLGLYRANSIYLEPSFLSIYSSLTIGLLVIDLYQKQIKPLKFTLYVLLNLFGMLSSLSGTGILCLIFLGVALVISMYKKTNKLVFLFGTLFLIVIGVISYNNDFFYSAIWTRASEIFSPGTSGYQRFSLTYQVMWKSITKYPLGIGPGNSSFAFDALGYSLNDFDSTFAKVLTECGWIGFLAFLGMQVYVFRLSKSSLLSFILFAFTFSLNFMGGLLLTTTFAIFLSFSLGCSNRYPKSLNCPQNETDNIKERHLLAPSLGENYGR
jgi:hypothetical protein